MERKKRERLEKAGWKVGSASEFLELTSADEAIIDLRLALSQDVRNRRQKQDLTQAQLAERLGVDQARVSRIEHNDATVSLDALFEFLFALGATKEDIGELIATA